MRFSCSVFSDLRLGVFGEGCTVGKWFERSWSQISWQGNRQHLTPRSDVASTFSSFLTKENLIFISSQLRLKVSARHREESGGESGSAGSENCLPGLRPRKWSTFNMDCFSDRSENWLCLGKPQRNCKGIWALPGWRSREQPVIQDVYKILTLYGR